LRLLLRGNLPIIPFCGNDETDLELQPFELGLARVLTSCVVQRGPGTTTLY
jgi:hypothetical protein